MARVRAQAEIISSLLDFFRIAQPKLDTKPGSVARDLLVEGISAQLSRLYDELNKVSNLQSLRLALGIDLDRLGNNFGASRLKGNKSTGLAVLTFSSLDSDISLNRGDIVTARNGASFTIVSSTVISSVFLNTYKANAARLRSELDFVGIVDEFAVEVLVEASTTGIQGNISKYSLSSTSIPGVNNITNTLPFGGGRASEDDASFRNRILSIFSGSNTGTSLGYRTFATSDPSVIDAVVIEPGDTLMTRDGTQVSTAENGTKTVISEGTGGKVDVIVYGQRLQDVLDSFVYRDLSNTNDPTNIKNRFVLGQIPADAGKTVTRKRLDNLSKGILPNQPVNNIVSVTGSVSGGNFQEESIDSLGRSSGNYRLVRDTGAYAGSPWAFDAIEWIDDRIRDFVEDKTKQTFNGQDPLGFPDVTEIGSVVQNIPVVNENSRTSVSDRSSLQLAHFPVTNVTRVFNATTGERYVVASQNPDGSGTINNTGRIKISGKSLPAISDILQVDYSWVYTYDPYFDYDNRVDNSNPRDVQDSLDWGFSNAVRREAATLTAVGSYLNVTVTHPISSIVSVNVFSTDTAAVTLASGRLSVIVDDDVTDVVSVVRSSDGAELWKTNKEDGSFSGQTIYLPTDTIGQFEDSVSVIYNTVDVFNTDSPGSFNNNVIAIVASSNAVAGTIVECNYIANISALLPAVLLPTLPALRSGNFFNTTAAGGIGCQPTTHLYSSPSVISKNLRQAPSPLAFTVAGTVSPGVITASGTTIAGVFDAVFTVSSNGLTQDLSTALKSALGLSSKTSVPSTIRLARICKVEKVTTDSTLNVLSSDFTYDLKGYRLFDSSYVKSESISNSLLSKTQFTLPSTSDNQTKSPKVGNRLRITFHYITASDSENVNFTKSGTLYTNKKFVLVDSVAISSGFTSAASATATLTIGNLNQPASRSRYKTSYDYLGPKTNERINIDYKYDRLITDATLTIENTRPINADVLVKASTPILVDAEMKITVTEEFKNSSTIVLQNVQDTITAALNATALGTKIDSSDLVNQAYTINGVDSARVTFFNRFDKAGSVLSITAEKNEYIRANTVSISLE